MVISVVIRVCVCVCACILSPPGRNGAGAVVASTHRRGGAVLLRGGVLSSGLTAFRGGSRF
jgi:hypothetical protein